MMSKKPKILKILNQFANITYKLNLKYLSNKESKFSNIWNWTLVIDLAFLKP